MNVLRGHRDTELVELLRAGDEKAFEIIYRALARKLFSYVRRNISTKEECEEIVQDIFELLWSRRQHIDIKISLEGYLLGIARHKIIRYFRKTGLRQKYRDHFLLFETVYHQMESEGEVDAPALQSALTRLIGELPQRCQQALNLRLSEDLSNRDIARRMHISTRTVETYMFKAFNHIRTSYRKYVANDG